MWVGKKKIVVLFCLIFFNSMLFAIDDAQKGIMENIVSGQKELVSKISKELLAISASINVEINTKLLEVDKEAFEKKFNVLLNGDSKLGFIKPNQEAVVNRLDELKANWDKLKKELVLENVTNNIEVYNKTNQKLLQLMDNIEQSIALNSIKNESYAVEPKKDIRFALSNLVDEVMELENKKRYIISISSRQTMLSQKIAKEAIFIALNIKADEYRENIISSAQLFDKSLNSLQKRYKDFTLGSIENDNIIKQIEFVKTKWNPFYENVKSLANSKKLDTKALKYIIKHNEKLLKYSYKLMILFKESRDIKSTMNKIAQNALDIADRQRMLSQKMLKEKLLIIAGIDQKEYKIKLRGTVLLFEHAIQGLLIGDEKRGLIKMEDERIIEKLKEALEIWNLIRLFYVQEITDEQLKIIISQNEPLLDKMTEIVDMIEFSTEL